MFNLDNYEDVDSRIHKFYETYPDGAISTELIMNDEEKGVVVFEARAYRTYVDEHPSAVGYARGARKDRGVDRDFWFENCETSAIGRCLANLGLSAKGKRASSLEMAKVNDSKSAAAPIRVRTQEQAEFLKQNNPDNEIVWDTTIEPPKDLNDYSYLEDKIEIPLDLLKRELGAEPIPQCQHGTRNVKEGTGAKGAYKGWMCPLPYSRKKEHCAPIWMVLDPSGRWSYRPEDEARITG